jgi:hypothetical protein
MENAFARIAWLEGIIRAQLPHIDLSSAPSLIVGQPEVTRAFEYETALHIPDEHTPNSSVSDLLYGSSATPKGNNYAQVSDPQSVHTWGTKAPPPISRDPSSRESSVEQDTRSVALDLGLLSLNSDSRQLHYVGSSSGSLFASLVRAGASSKRSNTAASPSEVDFPPRYSRDGTANLSSASTASSDVSRVYALLRTVGTFHR